MTDTTLIITQRRVDTWTANHRLSSHSDITVTAQHQGGVVALSIEYRTCDQEVVGSSLGRARGVKLWACFSHLCASVHQAVQVGTGQRAVMPCGSVVKAGMVRVWVAGKTV